MNMIVKNKTLYVQTSAVQRAPTRTVRTENERDRLSHPAGDLEQIVTKTPDALRPVDIVTLQRTIGNRAVQRLLNHQHHSVSAAPALQRRTEDEGPLQGKFGTVPVTKNRTGLPDNLKTGIENLSGLAMDDVRVHYNSSKPARVRALAYTQGTEIHLGPNQEKHLAHEAWHVVQQKRERVSPTLQLRGMPVNDDRRLEREAEAMGARLLQTHERLPQNHAGQSVASPQQVIQRAIGDQFQKTPGAVAGARLVQNFTKTNLFDPTVNVGYSAHVSIQKHLLESYRQREVLTPAALLNTIAKTSQNTFTTAFDLWVDHVIDYIAENSDRPPNGVTSNNQGLKFGTDGHGPAQEIHSFPVDSGNDTAQLDANQFNALKLYAKHYYGFGQNLTRNSYIGLINQVENDDAATKTAYELLGHNKVGAKRVLNRHLSRLQGEEIRLGYTFIAADRQ